MSATTVANASITFLAKGITEHEDQLASRGTMVLLGRSRHQGRMAKIMELGPTIRRIKDFDQLICSAKIG